MTSITHTPLIVIGGGLSGLIAATLVAKDGHSVVLIEKSSTLGGRAATRENMGSASIWARTRCIAMGTCSKACRSHFSSHSKR